MAARIVLPVPPDPMKSSDVPSWQTAMYSWGNDLKGKLETYSRQVSVAIDSTPIGSNAPSSGAFTTLSATKTISASGAISGASLAVTGAITGLSLTTTGAVSALTLAGAFNGTVGATTPNTGAFTTLTGALTGSLNGTVGSTTPNVGSFTTLTTTGANSLTLTNGTSNLINFGTNGVAAPSNTTRSAGTKIVLYSDVSSSSTDYALGINTNVLWQSVPLSTNSFVWYGNTTPVATLTGGGALAVNGILSGAQVQVVSSGNGTSLLAAGNSTNTGIVGFYNAAGTRQGYVGYAAAGGPIALNADPGTTGFATNTSFSAQGNITAGLGASGGGYTSKAGLTGGTTGNVFNLYWNGTNCYVYIDSTNLGAITFTSDERYKHSIESLPHTATDRVNRLRAVSYRYQDKGIFRDDGVSREGFVAQELKEVIPSAVNDGEVMSINSGAIVAVLTKALQEVNWVNGELKAAVADLSAKVAALEMDRKRA